MIDYSKLYDALAGTPQSVWLKRLPVLLESKFDVNRHGDLTRWDEALKRLPDIKPSSIDLNSGAIRVGTEKDIDVRERDSLSDLLQVFHPWRKGPFDVFGIEIETEWRSDWKWDRLCSAVSSLSGRRVLDIGSGNGYYGWRMVGAGAELVVGIDPYMLYVMQYQAIRHFLAEHPAFVLPLRIEDLPEKLSGFDTVFSMGVLYHRRSPIEHLLRLKDLLAVGGELVLETLVIDGGAEEVLVPVERYAMMRNVWNIPSPAALIDWLKQGGFRDVKLVDVTTTSVAEQRSTPWMRFHSLSDFLDAENPQLTLEGYPRPQRAIVIAQR